MADFQELKRVRISRHTWTQNAIQSLEQTENTAKTTVAYEYLTEL